MKRPGGVAELVLAYLLRQHGFGSSSLRWVEICGTTGVMLTGGSTSGDRKAARMVDLAAIGLAVNAVLDEADRDIYYQYLYNGRRIKTVRELLSCGRTKAYDWVDEAEAKLYSEFRARRLIY